ncbi:MAG: NADH-quinone oxidoreductase subunit N [Fimbriimonadaceae bacterium]|nr:NADH-quinone oxidoreductase subunit N [Fimbriimonadaceae bacterium]
MYNLLAQTDGNGLAKRLAEAFPPPTIDWPSILPIALVVCTGIVALIVEMLRPRQNNNAIIGFSLVGLFFAGLSLTSQFASPDLESFGGMVLRDRFSLTIQLLVVMVTGLTILFSDGYLRAKRIPFGEFYPLVLWSASGAMMMASSKNLLMIFLGIEVLSISLYVLAGMSKTETKSEESALKYFLLGAFASAFLLYGIAFMYGATGSLHLDAIRSAWNPNDEAFRNMMLFGMGLMLFGLAFKAAFVPFHQWTPDVYQGAPTNVTAFMAAGSKIGAMAALWRLLSASTTNVDLGATFQSYWMPALFWIAILTMTVGNLVALVQKDVKRTLGYSSIAHAGYILVGILAHVNNPEKVGIGTTVFYLLSYSLMTIGAFAVVSLTAKNGKEGTRFEDLHGLWKRSPFAVGCLIVFVASLIGIPPTSGFFGKLMIFNDALASDLMPLAIVLAVNSVLSVYYYVGIAKAAFVDAEGARTPESAPMNLGLAATCLLCAGGIFAVVILFNPLMNWLVGAP